MTAIYHITHLDNLPGLVARGELLADTQIQLAGLAPTSIAHGNIKQRRSQTAVTTGNLGFVADYVPFYFCPRSPMLYSIHRGQVAGYPGGQAGVLHLVLSAEAVVGAGVACCHTDGHAAMQPLTFYPGVSGLTALDWPVIGHTSWHNTSDDNDRKRRKQAEFLAWQRVPWHLVSHIGVIDAIMAARVAASLAGAAHLPIIEVHRDWYYY